MTGKPIIRGATLEDFDEVTAATATAFGDPGSSWPADDARNDPNHRPELHRLCMVDGKIVSAMRIVCQDVRYGVAILKHTGVADVGTLPEYRNRGYSTMVLKDAIKYMEALGGHFSMLYTGIQPFYERLGWASLPLRDDRFNISDARPEASSRWKGQVVSFDASRHLAGYRQLYDEFNASRTATTVRDARYWELRFASRKRRGDVLVAVAGDELEASVVFGIHGKRKRVNVTEYAWRAEAENALEALIAELIRRGQKAGAEMLVCDLSSDEATRALTSRLVEPMEAEEWTDLMFRIIDLPGLLRAALPELSERSAKAAQKAAGARLRLSWEAEAALLALEMGELNVSEGTEEAAAQLELNSAELVQLIFGRGAAAVQEHLAALPDKERALAEALFPGEQLVVWGTDSF